MTAAPQRRWLAAAAVAAVFGAFLLSVIPFLGIEPGIDSLGSIWQAREIPARCWLFDPLCAGYVYVLFFEPAYTALHVPVLWLEPLLGMPAHHLAGIAGMMLLGSVLAWTLFEATRSVGLALGAAALALLSLPSWVSVADTRWCHYPWASAFGLLALRPFFLAWWRGAPPGWGAALGSSLAYGAGLACKESVAGIPALCAVLALSARTPPARTVRLLLPHAAVLAGFAAWRFHILGGLGGYFFGPEWVPENLARAMPVVFRLTFGSAWLALALFGLQLVAVPRTALLAALAVFVGVLPFVLAFPIQPLPEFAARLLLPYALLLLFCGAAWAQSASTRFRRASATAMAALLLLALSRHGSVTVPTLLPAVPAMPWTRPVAVVSDQWLSFAFLHQLDADPGAPLLVFRTKTDVVLGRALGLDIPADALRVGTPPEGAAPKLVPLDQEGVGLQIDELGRAHVRLPDTIDSALRLALVYRNGGVRWLASFPLLRARIDFPLNPSIESVLLFAPSRYPEWPARIVRSPFFQDPYPGPGAGP